MRLDWLLEYWTRDKRLGGEEDRGISAMYVVLEAIEVIEDIEGAGRSWKELEGDSKIIMVMTR